MDAQERVIRVTFPSRIWERQAWNFLKKHRDWVANRWSSIPPAIHFENGVSIPVLGKNLELRFTGEELTGKGRGKVQKKGRLLLVPGGPDDCDRYLREWLKAQLREELERLVSSLTRRIGRKVTSISLRDMRTRWGSCSSKGRLTFTWRLVFAPPAVLHYMVVHEMAHLREMNHGAHFWEIVERLCPRHETHRKWLKQHGDQLHRYQI